MRKIINKYFVPNAGNGYLPHALHTKRTVFYGSFFLATKMIVLGFAMAVPTQVFVLPEVLAQQQKEIIVLTNETRVSNGLPSLADSDKLDQSSRDKANDMAVNDYFAHSNDGKNVSNWIKGTGYKYLVAGENLAVGFNTAQQVVDAWKQSPTHYANLVDLDYQDVGVGVVGGTYNGQPAVYVAQHLARPFVAQENKPVSAVVSPPTTKPAAIPLDKPSGQVEAQKVEAEPTAPPPVISNQTPSIVQKYILAKSLPESVTKLFFVSETIYLIGIIFFALALALGIFIAIRTQHKRIIIQTCGLIAILVILWRV
jgi:uncharacterized protein YkwD